MKRFKFFDRRNKVTVTLEAASYSEALEMVGIGYTLLSIDK
jgi:hypothetical protein